MSRGRQRTEVEVTRNAAALTMGIIGTVLGVLGMLIGWIPFLGMFGIPVIIIGGLCALGGVFIAMAKSFNGWAMPTLGTVVCIGALCVTTFIQVASVEVVSQSIESVEKAVEKHEQQANTQVEIVDEPVVIEPKPLAPKPTEKVNGTSDS